jgi:protein-S-isoprenylcysteine O-methyltransferase Ste14
MNTGPSTPNIRIPPPLLLAVVYVVGWILETQALRLQLSREAVMPRTLRFAGEALIMLGAILTLWSMLTFRRAATPVLPNRPASQLVTTGPYRLSRNPIYVGLAAMYAGLAIVMNMAWPLLLLPIALVLLYHLVISREERYLSHRFGEEYSAYQRRVRRWL